MEDITPIDKGHLFPKPGQKDKEASFFIFSYENYYLEEVLDLIELIGRKNIENDISYADYILCPTRKTDDDEWKALLTDDSRAVSPEFVFANTRRLYHFQLSPEYFESPESRSRLPWEQFKVQANSASPLQSTRHDSDEDTKKRARDSFGASDSSEEEIPKPKVKSGKLVTVTLPKTKRSRSDFTQKDDEILVSYLVKLFRGKFETQAQMLNAIVGQNPDHGLESWRNRVKKVRPDAIDRYMIDKHLIPALVKNNSLSSVAKELASMKLFDPLDDPYKKSVDEWRALYRKNKEYVGAEVEKRSK